MIFVRKSVKSGGIFVRKNVNFSDLFVQKNVVGLKKSPSARLGERAAYGPQSADRTTRFCRIVQPKPITIHFFQKLIIHQPSGSIWNNGVYKAIRAHRRSVDSIRGPIHNLSRREDFPAAETTAHLRLLHELLVLERNLVSVTK